MAGRGILDERENLPSAGQRRRCPRSRAGTLKSAIIIGAGPAGLTAAYELLERTDVEPIVFEMTDDVGGISRTVEYKGNRIDIGGHRFFSKADRVMNWWRDRMPLQTAPSSDDLILGRDPVGPGPKATEADPEKMDRVMLLRGRLSRIFFLRRFFDYPVSLNFNTIANLGLFRIARIGVSYVLARAFPVRVEKSLEDFFINRFGRELYKTFFKDYTEKVWGVPCNRIKPEWGAQRIKGLSVRKVLAHAIKALLTSKDASVAQKSVETSLIDRFMYPKLGPGQMWHVVRDLIISKGGEIRMGRKCVALRRDGQRVVEADFVDADGAVETVKGDYFFSTMPIKDLIRTFGEDVPDHARKVAEGLLYRDFMTVGLLLNKLKLRNETGTRTVGDIVPDNWIYIQEPEVKVGRLQIFNNWSPYMVADPSKVWVGLEYFCDEGDELWSMPDADFIRFAIDELALIGIIDKADVLDSTLIRMPKAYPAYFGTYDSLHLVRDFVDGLENLFLIGRNGMHKYNNQDHSMLCAMTAVDNIAAGILSKENIWSVNTEEEYHEEKAKALPAKVEVVAGL